MKNNVPKLTAVILAALMVFMTAAAYPADAGRTAPEGYNESDYEKVVAFLENTDANGVKNGEKLNAAYDPSDPQSWGALAGNEPRFSWTEVDGELRLEGVACSDVQGRLFGALELSGCTALKRVECANSALTAISVDGCTALERLICKRNELTALSVSGCTALTELNCATNSIEALDVSTCTALRFLECRWNLIRELELENCPALSVLICTDNRLKELDLRSNPLLVGVKHLRMVDSGNKFISCFIANDPEYTSASEYFISADCADGCTTYNGWYTEDGRFITDYTVFSPTLEQGGSFVARFTLYGSAPGDADGDGSVTLNDALKIMRISLQLLPMQQGAGADVNGDGVVNMTDAMLVMRRAMAV